MLTTMNRDEWKENPGDQVTMNNMTMQSNPDLMRRLFPLRGKLTRFCRVHQLDAGTVLEYVRTKHEPAYYPLEALVTNQRNGQAYKSSYGSDELEILVD